MTKSVSPHSANLEGSPYLHLVIGMSARNPLGFLYLWSSIGAFVWANKRAPGCIQVLPGISSPISVILLSYWESEEALASFVRSKPHRKWMKFFYRFPSSLNLYNETYRSPISAKYHNQPKGYAYCTDVHPHKG